MTHPLCDRSMISARLDAVAELAESMGSYKVTGDTTVLDNENWDVEVKQAELNYLLSSVLTYLGRSPDLQRGITRIFYRTATASEVIIRLPVNQLELVLVNFHFLFGQLCSKSLNYFFPSRKFVFKDIPHSF